MTLNTGATGVMTSAICTQGYRDKNVLIKGGGSAIKLATKYTS